MCNELCEISLRGLTSLAVPVIYVNIYDLIEAIVAVVFVATKRIGYPIFVENFRKIAYTVTHFHKCAKSRRGIAKLVKRNDNPWQS